MTRGDLFVADAMSHIGTPYVWGSQKLYGPDAAVDCSGFLIAKLQAWGELPAGFDTTASGLFKLDAWQDKHINLPVPTYLPGANGAFLFFGPSIHDINHVEIYAGYGMMVGASGGDHTCTKPWVKPNACVKLRRVDSRKDLVGAIQIW